MNEKHRWDGFKASVKDHRTTGSFFEELDGSLRLWKDLSAQGKLAYTVRDAAMYDVPFEQFAEEVRDAIGDTGDASLRLVLHSERELLRLARLLPDDGRTESTPLVERFKEILNDKSERAADAPAEELEQRIER